MTKEWYSSFGCECGAEKVYQKNCKDWMHSDWCPCFRSKDECDESKQKECTCGGVWNHAAHCPQHTP